MDNLKIMLFGGVRITHDNWRSEVILPREIQALLAYLLLQRHRLHSRDVLAGVFWGEYSQERARGSLNTALWKLKKALEPDGVSPGTYLKNGGYPGEIGFNRGSQYWLDIEIFEGGANHILKNHFQEVEETRIVDLENLVKLYRGELLEGFYDNWALWERERQRALYLKCLIYLMQYYGLHNEYEKAIAHGQKILSLDIMREEVHREMMKLFLKMGERSMALRQYDLCRSALAENYGIAPLEETQALYLQIFENGNGDFLHANMGQIHVDQVLQQLMAANQAIDLVKEQIQQAVQLISKYPDFSDRR